jgi:hypothetical protein
MGAPAPFHQRMEIDPVSRTPCSFRILKQWTKSRNLVILSVMHHHENLLEKFTLLEPLLEIFSVVVHIFLAYYPRTSSVT